MNHLDWRGILERAGADENAPEGSQGHSLFLLAEAIAELVQANSDFDAWLDRVFSNFSEATPEQAQHLRIAKLRRDESLAALNSGATP